MTRTRIAVVGECLIDIVESDGARTEHVGGSPLNVAVTLGRLGDDVELLTALGADTGGGLIRAHLQSSGVRLHAATHELPATSSARAIIDDNGAASYDFDLTWQLDQLPPPDAGWVHTGSLGSWLLPGAVQVAQMLCGPSGDAIRSLDPNIRPALIADDGHAVRERVLELIGLVDVVKLSSKDATWLFGTDSCEVLEDILQRGPAVAALTLAEKGAVLQSQTARADIAPVAVSVQDTIGAGDSFMGAMIHSTSRVRSGHTDMSLRPLTADELSDIGGFASHVAARTIARAGANPPWASEL